MNIVTSVCIDTIQSDNTIYPMLKGEEDKKIVYFRCAVTFFLTSIKFNPNADHIIYTNDSEIENLYIDDYKLSDILYDLGVKIHFLPFNKFNPKHYSNRFKNAFYKQEVINALASLNKPSILLDSDCIWTSSCDDLFNKINQNKCLLLQDTYQRNSTPKLKKPHNLSMKDMGELYQKIPLMEIQTENPIWYGGELIGGNPEHFKIVADNILNVLEFCKKQADKQKNSITFNNGASIFDNDEYISSYVYNSLKNIPIYDTYGVFSKRVWTLDYLYNFIKKDYNIAIWHLPGEKETGLKNLFHELIDPKSHFWSSTGSLPVFLGKYFNIPRTKKSKSKILLTKCKNILKRILP